MMMSLEGLILPIIFALGLGLIIWMVITWFKMQSIKNDLDRELEPIDGKIIKKSKSNVKAYNVTERIKEINPEAVLEKASKFYDICSRHEMQVQLIPLLSLLGMLGTVVGLAGLIDPKTHQIVIDSLNGAMQTTEWGLGFTIALKFLDAIWFSKPIFDVDVMMDNYEQHKAIEAEFDEGE